MEVQPKKHWAPTPLAGLADSKIGLDKVEKKIDDSWAIVPKFFTSGAVTRDERPLPSRGLTLTPSVMSRAVNVTWQGITLPYYAASWLIYYTTYPLRCLTSAKVVRASMEIVGLYGANYVANLEAQAGIVAVEYATRSLCTMYNVHSVATRIIVSGTTATIGGAVGMLVISMGCWAGVKTMGCLFKMVKGVWYRVDPEDGKLKEVPSETSRELDKINSKAREITVNQEELETLRAQITEMQEKITSLES